MSAGSEFKGQQIGRCSDCYNKINKKSINGKIYKWCNYYKKWCRYIAWNCTVHYITPLEGKI